MPTAPQLREDQREYAWRRSQERAGAAFVGFPHPEHDTRSFPCSRCGTGIVRGALVRGELNEYEPGWPLGAAFAIGCAVAALIWWTFGWGPIAAVVGLIAASAAMLGPLRRYWQTRIENQKLASFDLPLQSNTELRNAGLILAGALMAAALVWTIYSSLGWPPFVISIVALIAAAVIANALVARATRLRERASVTKTSAGDAEYEFRGVQNRIVDSYLDARRLASDSATEDKRFGLLLKEAAKPHAASQFKAARAFARGSFEQANRLRAAEFYERVADHKVLAGKALWELGELYELDSKDRDLAKAQHAYERMKAFFHARGDVAGTTVAERHLGDIQRLGPQGAGPVSTREWNQQFARTKALVYVSVAFAALLTIAVVAYQFPPIKESDTVGNASDALAAGDLDGALAAARGAARRDGTSDAFLTYGAALAAAGRPADAAKAYDQVLQQQPDDETARLARATARRAAGNLTGAADDYRALLARQADSVMYQALLDEVEHQMGKR